MIRARLQRIVGGAPLLPLLVLLGLNAVDELDKVAFAVLNPEIASSFDISAGTAGAIGALGYLTVFVAAYPLGFLADRTRRLTVAVAGATLWAVATLLTGVVAGVVLLVAVRVLAGVGQAVNRPVHSSLLSDYYPPERRASVFGVYYLGNPIGLLVAPVAAVVIAAIASDIRGLPEGDLYWQPAFWLLALPTVALVLLSFRLLEPPRGGVSDLTPEEARQEHVPLREAFRTILTIRTLRRDYAGAVLVGGAAVALPLLIANFYEQAYDLGPLGRGVLFSSLVVPAVLGNLVGGRLGDRYFAESPEKTQRLIGLAFIGIGVSFGLAAGLRVFWLSVVFTLLGVFCNGLYNGPGARINAAVVPPRIRAQGFATVEVFLVAGFATALPAFVVLDEFGPRWGVFSLTPLLVVGGLIYWSAQQFVRNDIERARDALVAERARVVARREGRTPLLLEVTGLRAGYGGNAVIEDIDLTVEEGGVVAVLGTNGAGKSTLLRAISGAIEPMGGRVLFEGYDVTGFDPQLTVARGIVQVPGGQGVFPGLTVAEHLRLAAVPLRDKRRAREGRERALELFPVLGERQAQLAGTLSGGEQQMLTFAQALIGQPKLLMIDELSLGLSPKVVAELVAVVERIHAAGTAVILVEQSVNVALTLADEAVFLEKGRVRFRGATGDLLERADLLRSIFLGATR